MLSQNVRNITPSLTRILFSKAAEYDSVIDLTLGDTDFAPPHEVQNLACEAIIANLAHYSPNEGIFRARELAAKNIRKVYGLHGVSVRNIILYLYVISDEVYRSLVFDGEHTSVIQRPRNPENIIIANSLSKEYSMMGYRIGYGQGV
ncbi:MAG: aminotransferase class I/II-fold pyridoxal phosphate-dependent enzyme [Synergistaceae bacterium]|nr:aminotransferase class I/II-fold pyridoxal phosphate-dependent enzyme [Synergistaceae bacterium]